MPAEKIVNAVSQESAVDKPLIIDLGKQRRKRIKRLRRGEGPLMERIDEAIEDLKAAGKIPANACPVIVIVKQKKRNRGWLL